MFSMNNNKYPQNEEEKQNMKKPFAVAKCPLKLFFCQLGLSQKQARNTLIALVGYRKISPFAMVRILELHSNQKLSWQARKLAISACAEDPNFYLNVMAAINCSHFEKIHINQSILAVMNVLLLINVLLGILILQVYNRVTGEMVNYNMGQYYAWTNLTKLLKSFYRKHFFSPQYNFTPIPPKIHTNFSFIPFQSWKANRIRDESESKYTFLAICLLTFFISKFTYQVVHDEDIGYYYHTQNPIVSQSVAWIYSDLEEFANPFLQIIPKNKYDIVMIYPRFFELLLGSEARIKKQDERALQLRREIAEYDGRLGSERGESV